MYLHLKNNVETYLLGSTLFWALNKAQIGL